MFEDFKEKVGKLQNKHDSEIPLMSTELAPEIIDKLSKAGINPDNFTIQQLFPPTYDDDGNDLSLMSGAEWEIMITYGKTRKYLVEKYPQSQEEAKMLWQEWAEEPDEPYQIDIAKSQGDPQGRIFVNALFQMKAIYDKVEVLQRNASDYEKYCLRLYWHLTYNWTHAPEVKSFREVLPVAIFSR
jgi:hypothetical protein